MNAVMIGLAIAAAGVAGAFAACLLRDRFRKITDKTVYARRRPMNSYEQALYWRLVKTLPDHVVLPKVAMKRCIAVRGANSAVLARQSLDFVICDKAMRLIAAIEVDDESADPGGCREQIRKIKEEALEATGIRLIRCSVHNLLSEAFIAMEFKGHSSLMGRIAA